MHSFIVGERLAVFTKLKIILPYNPTVAFPGIYQKDMKTYDHIKTYM